VAVSGSTSTGYVVYIVNSQVSLSDANNAVSCCACELFDSLVFGRRLRRTIRHKMALSKQSSNNLAFQVLLRTLYVRVRLETLQCW
jgi:hypothetical protein